jgi:glutaredoxin 3
MNYSKNNYLQLDEIEYEIYTKSNCVYCSEVKKLLNNQGKQYKENNSDHYLTNQKTKETFLNSMKYQTGKDIRTFPIVFKNGVYIGGYTETHKIIEKENAFNFI